MIKIDVVEADLVGAAITNPRITEIHLTADQFQDPRAGATWEAIRTLHRQGQQPNPITIIETAAAASSYRLDHRWIIDLVGRGMPADAETYANRITDAANRRSFAQALNRATQALQRDDPLDQIAANLATQLTYRTPGEQEAEQVQTLAEFVSQQLPPEEWVIPDLLAKGDRLVLTGSEGSGKSVMLGQIAVCAAAGICPFTGRSNPSRRVLLIDAENPNRIMIERFRWLSTAAVNAGGNKQTLADHLQIHRKPQGMALNRPADRLLLRELVRVWNPDMLVIGPAYKLAIEGAHDNHETIARSITSILDQIREEHNLAILVETHSPHADTAGRRPVRPIGSSLWLRWPEFGYGIAKDQNAWKKHHRVADFTPWRGNRADRAWPERIEQGNTLPWVEAPPT